MKDEIKDPPSLGASPREGGFGSGGWESILFVCRVVSLDMGPGKLRDRERSVEGVKADGGSETIETT